MKFAAAVAAFASLVLGLFAATAAAPPTVVPLPDTPFW